MKQFLLVERRVDIPESGAMPEGCRLLYQSNDLDEAVEFLLQKTGQPDRLALADGGIQEVDVRGD